MSEISENDKRKSIQQVVERLQQDYCILIESRHVLETMLTGLINDFPPGEPDEPGVPCEHGFDDNFWCACCHPGVSVEPNELYGQGGDYDRGER